MKITDIMSGGVQMIDPGTTVRDAARRLRDADVGALPIGENDRLTGMITDRDIAVRAVAGDKDPDKSIVDEIKSEAVYYCYDEDEAERAADVMAEHQVRQLPIVNSDKRLVGMVSLADLTKAGVCDRALVGVTTATSTARA